MAINGYYDITGLFIGFNGISVKAPIPVQPKKRLQFTKPIDPKIKLELNSKYNISEENKTDILVYFTTINTTLFKNKNVNIMDLYLLWSMNMLPDNIKTVVAPIFQDSTFYVHYYFWGLFPIIKEIFTKNNIPYEEYNVHFSTIYILWYIIHSSFSNIENGILKKLLCDIYYEMNIINPNYNKAFSNEKLSQLMPYILEDNQFEIMQNEQLKVIVKDICIKLRDI